MTEVYKTKEGRRTVEDYYGSVLEKYSYLGFKQLFVDADGIRTHVLKFGKDSSPSVIMIHGSTSNSAAWFGCAAEFAEKFCVYCVDIPGEPGLSKPERMDLGSDRPQRWLTSLMDNLGLEDAGFVTMSLGSWYALNLGMHIPGKVKAVSMLTAPGLVPPRKSFILKAVVSMLLGKAGQRMLNKAIYYKAEVQPEAAEFQAAVSPHFRPMTDPIPLFSNDQLSRVSFPLQYFGGDHDALIDSVKTAERLKSTVPGADVRVLEETGHVILDRFDEIADFIAAAI